MFWICLKKLMWMYDLITNVAETRRRLLSFILFFGSLFLTSCTAGVGSMAGNTETTVRDTSCSYFYFLWGAHQEFSNHNEEALEAYRNALICDPSDSYIKQKLPILHLKMEETEKAIELLRENISASPDDINQRALLARIYMQQKKEAEAIEQYQQILTTEPDNKQALLRLGILLNQTGALNDATRYLKKLLSIDQEAYFAHLYLARIADKQDNQNTASREYKRALDLNYSPELVYEIGEFYLKHERYEELLETMRFLLKRDSSEQRARFTLVQALLALNKEQEAIAELSAAQEFSNNPVRVSLLISRLYMKNGDNQNARKVLQTVITEEENSEARYLLALIEMEEEQFPEALTHLSAITAFDEEFEDSIILQSRIFHDTDQAEQGIALLKEMLEKEETRREMFFILAASLYQQNEQLDPAQKILAEGIDSFPESERLLFEYGMVLERADRLEEALEVMNRLLELNPDHAEALNFIGYSWADTDRNLEQALDYITRAMELKPGNGYIQDSLGWVHFKLGNFEMARIQLTEALSLVPDDPHIYDHLGDVYRALGKPKEALKSYKSALKYFEDQKKKEMVRKKIEVLTEQN